jgi:uncharacterized protein YehS (DUF1456 family)
MAASFQEYPMTNNDIFRRLRYALDLSNPAVIEAFKLSGKEIGQPEVISLLKKEGDEGYLECSDPVLESFLDGLIALKRGKRPGEPGATSTGGLSNNDILRKIRIALELKEADMLTVFKLAEFPTSKSELTALFRTKGHENFKECGDQLLRNFLKGLTVKYRDNPAKK